MRAENPGLASYIDAIRTAFDPLESQYIIALSMMRANETQTIADIITDTKSNRVVPLIRKEDVLQACLQVNDNVQHAVKVVTDYYGINLIQKINGEGCDEVSQIALLRGGKELSTNSVSFTSLFKVYHTIRGALARERKSSKTTGQRSEDPKEGINSLRGVADPGKDSGHCGVERDI